MASSFLRPGRTLAPLLNASRPSSISRLFYSSSRQCNAPENSELGRDYAAKVSDKLGSTADMLEDTSRQVDADRYAQRQQPAFMAGAKEVTRDSHLATLPRFTLPHFYSLKYATTANRKRGRAPKLGPDPQTSRKTDIFAQLGLDPVREASNRSLMASFVTDMGKIRGRADTKLTRKSQRRLGKAIRRAKMMGLTPMLSRALPAPLTNTLGAKDSVKNYHQTRRFQQN